MNPKKKQIIFYIAAVVMGVAMIGAALDAGRMTAPVFFVGFSLVKIYRWAWRPEVNR